MEESIEGFRGFSGDVYEKNSCLICKKLPAIEVSANGVEKIKPLIITVGENKISNRPHLDVEFGFNGGILGSLLEN